MKAGARTDPFRRVDFADLHHRLRGHLNRMTTTHVPWQVQIQGLTSDLEYLTHYFGVGPTRVVRDAQYSFVFEADAFVSCSSPEEVLTIAEKEFSVRSALRNFDT